MTLSDGVSTLIFATNSSAAFPRLIAPGQPYTVTIVGQTTADHVHSAHHERRRFPATGVVDVIVTCT